MPFMIERFNNERVYCFLNMWWLFKKRDRNIDDKLNKMNSSLKNSFSNIKADIIGIKGWLSGLQSKHNNYDERLSLIEENLHKILDLVVQNKEEDIEDMNAIERVQSFNRSDQSFMNVQSGKLTPAQKQIIALLTYSEFPLNYEDISKKLKINIVTARRHINDILRAGFEIKQKMDVKSRRKVFFMDSEAKKVVLRERKRKKRGF